MNFIKINLDRQTISLIEKIHLLYENREQGYVDYVLWSIFEPDDLELDSELTMNCIGNGMVMTKSPTSELDALDACCRDALNTPPKNLVILMKNEE